MALGSKAVRVPVAGPIQLTTLNLQFEGVESTRSVVGAFGTGCSRRESKVAEQAQVNSAPIRKTWVEWWTRTLSTMG